MSAYIKALDYYLPEKILTNEEIVKEFPEWSVDKIAKKVGVTCRHIAADHETALDMARKSYRDGKKRVLVVKGGPGTGKSVIAIQLLSKLTQLDQFVQYVSKNSAPRNVYAEKLKGTIKKCSVDNLFKGSGAYTEIGKKSDSYFTGG